jgi:hypothetical protein
MEGSIVGIIYIGDELDKFHDVIKYFAVIQLASTGFYLDYDFDLPLTKEKLIKHLNSNKIDSKTYICICNESEREMFYLGLKCGVRMVFGKVK